MLVSCLCYTNNISSKNHKNECSQCHSYYNEPVCVPLNKQFRVNVHLEYNVLVNSCILAKYIEKENLIIS